MSELFNKIKLRYFTIVRPLVANSLFLLFIYVLYRIRIYYYIKALYPDMQIGGFFEYARLSIHYDSIAFLISGLALFLILFFTAGSSKIKYALASISVVLMVFFLLFSMEFFRVYETSFQRNFAGKEHFTGLGNVVDSALAEFSFEFYLLFIVFSLLALFLNILLFRNEQTFSDSSRDCSCMIRPESGIIRYISPVIFIVLIMVGVSTSASIPADRFAARYKKDPARSISLLQEFSMNPVYNLFLTPEQDVHNKKPVTGRNRLPFSFRLNTDSPGSSRWYTRNRLIPGNKKYNIILYFFESTPQRYYSLKINGRPVIGTWHRLEQNSMNFKNHYANYPLSANALLSVLASAYDLNTQDMVIQKYPDIPLRTMPEILKDHGYRTCLIHTGGLGYAGQNRFLANRKIDQIIEYNQLIKSPPYNHQVGWGIDERAMIKPAVDFIGKQDERPCLLILLPVNPHHPYAIPDASFKLAGDIPDDADYKTRNWHNYLNSLHYADASLGLLVDELERQGLLDDTLLFLFADHGEAFYQHKMNYNHPLFIYNENVHVPFLIYNKRIFNAPEYYSGITRHIDIMPTILDIIGIPQVPEAEGIPILSTHREQMALLHTSWKDDYMGLVDQQWKYIYRTKDGFEELYNLSADPDEKNNIASRHAEVTEQYRNYVLSARDHKDQYYLRVLKKKFQPKD